MNPIGKVFFFVDAFDVVDHVFIQYVWMGETNSVFIVYRL